MILTLLALLFVDYLALGAGTGVWARFWCELWLLFLSLAAGYVGAVQAVGWSQGREGLRHGLKVLAGDAGGAARAETLVQLLSGCCLLFGGLTWFLRTAAEHGWLDHWSARTLLWLLIQWLRLAPLGLLGLGLGPMLAALGGTPRAAVYGILAMAGSVLGWNVLWDLFGRDPSLEFWQFALYLMAMFPTYGCGLLWGGVFWWPLSRRRKGAVTGS